MRYEEQLEWLTCAESASYFIDRYCYIYDATLREWLPFHLWRAQSGVLETISVHQLIVILKARQLGLSGLVICYALWLMLFRPEATILLFSRRDDESVHLLDFRLKGTYTRLPDWIRSTATVSVSNDHQWILSTGSAAYAFPTTAGDSYTATLAIVDEADLILDLNKLMGAVKPTIDGGGQMILVSRADKSKPNSEFKRIYRAAKAGQSPWTAIFLPWWSHPKRNSDWYEDQRKDIVSRTSALDDLHEQYPADDVEALAARTLDKRISSVWLDQCYVPLAELDPLPVDAPVINRLVIYREPERGKSYLIGGDPAEGNPTSNDSALTVLEEMTGEEVAKLNGKFQPSTFASHISEVSAYFNDAPAMIERNNHGHAVLLWLRDNSRVNLLYGFDYKEGWHSTSYGKTRMYTAATDAFREKSTITHSFESYLQLSSIDGSTLRAPDGEMDDLADSYALAIIAREFSGSVGI